MVGSGPGDSSHDRNAICIRVCGLPQDSGRLAELSIGRFSAAESLGEGVRVLLEKLDLLLPFFAASMVGVIPFILSPLMVMRVGPFSQPLVFYGLEFVASLIAWLIGAWGAWIIVMRYRSLGVAKGLEGQDIRYSNPWFFLSPRNRLLWALIGVGSVLSVLSILGRVPVGVRLGRHVVLENRVSILLCWLVSLAFIFAVYGILVRGLSWADSIRLSTRIFSNNPLSTLGLAIGLAVIALLFSYLFRTLMLSMLFPFTSSYPPWGTVLMSVGQVFSKAISGGLSASCLAYAFLRSLGYIDSVRAGVVRGSSFESCSGEPKIPDCLGCPHLQDFGDRYLCTRFSKILRKPGDAGNVGGVAETA